MVEHRNVTYNLTGMDGILGFAPGRDEPGTWLSITSLSFDPSVIDLFWTLSRGFKVVIYDDALDEDDNSPGSIPSLIETHAVTHTQCVPTRARMLLASERGEA